MSDRLRITVKDLAWLFDGLMPRLGDVTHLPVITDFRGPQSDVSLLVVSLDPPQVEFLEESVLVRGWPDIQVDRFPPSAESIAKIRADIEAKTEE